MVSLWSTVLCFSAGALICSGAIPSGVDPTFDPGRGALSVKASSANSVLVQPDGKILLTGEFNAVNIDFAAAVVRFNTDGSPDGSFNDAAPTPSSSTNADDAAKLLALQANGQVLLAGKFNNADGSARYLTRLNADGSVDTTFNPRIESTNGSPVVFRASVLSGGRVLISGRFTRINGVARAYLARLNFDGSIDETFSAAVASTSFAVQATGKVVVASGNQLVRLNIDGTLDNTFTTVPVPQGTYLGQFLVQPDDKLIWTTFRYLPTLFSATTISRLNADGTNDSTFQPFYSGGGGPLFLQADGRLVIYTYGDGDPYRLNADGTPDRSFQPNAIGSFFAQQPDGKLVTAGEIYDRPYGIRRLFLDGSRDNSFAPELGLTRITALSIDRASLLPNGKIVIAGNFNYIDRIPRTRIAVLNANGTLDLNFDAGALISARLGVSDLHALAVQSDRKIIVAVANNLMRLDSDGSVDQTFHYNSTPHTYVSALGIQASGKIVLTDSPEVTRLNPDGSVDSTFHADAAGNLDFIQPDGKILLHNNNGLIRLSDNGAFDAGFNADGVRGFLPPTFLALQPNGKILLARFLSGVETHDFTRLNRDGSIDQIFDPAFRLVWAAAADLTGIYFFGNVAPGGEPYQREIGRLFDDGNRDPNFRVQFNSGADLTTLLIQPDGQLLVAGSFDHVNGVARAGIARLNGAAPKKLANISTRVRVGDDQRLEIGGFIITGDAPKKVIVRSLGPSLGANGVIGSDLLANPSLELHDSTGAIIAQNDNWRDTQEAEVMASGIPPVENTEAAIVAILAPGPYTAVIQGRDGGEGIALAEVYDLDPASDSSLANISTRGFVSINDGVMIAGFILRGAEPSTIVARAIGPSLVASGIAGVVADPTLELHDADGTMIGANDNWRENEAEVRETGLPPSDDLESALVRTLPPGAYTAILRGKNNTTGIGLVEIYNLR